MWPFRYIWNNLNLPESNVFRCTEAISKRTELEDVLSELETKVMLDKRSETMIGK